MGFDLIAPDQASFIIHNFDFDRDEEEGSLGKDDNSIDGTAESENKGGCRAKQEGVEARR